MQKDPLLTIKIQSYSDIITNSSSEVFLIQTKKSKEDFEKWWRKILMRYEYDPNDSAWFFEDTYVGQIEEVNEGKFNIRINYPCMCNVGEEAREALQDKVKRVRFKEW